MQMFEVFVDRNVNEFLKDPPQRPRNFTIALAQVPRIGECIQVTNGKQTNIYRIKDILHQGGNMLAPLLFV